MSVCVWGGGWGDRNLTPSRVFAGIAYQLRTLTIARGGPCLGAGSCRRVSAEGRGPCVRMRECYQNGGSCSVLLSARVGTLHRCRRSLKGGRNLARLPLMRRNVLGVIPGPALTNESCTHRYTRNLNLKQTHCTTTCTTINTNSLQLIIKPS